MSEQAKREPGRSRKAERRQRIDITLPQSAIDYLDKQQVSRSRFIEMLVQAHMETEQARSEFFATLNKPKR
jgi:hypothetical protein